MRRNREFTIARYEQFVRRVRGESPRVHGSELSKSTGGSQSRTRTCNLAINSRLLCQLSYLGKSPEGVVNLAVNDEVLLRAQPREHSIRVRGLLDESLPARDALRHGLFGNPVSSP